jgi:hypothetical protein
MADPLVQSICRWLRQAVTSVPSCVLQANMAPGENLTSVRRAERLKTVAVAVLVSGLIAASIIYWAGERRHGEIPDSRIATRTHGSWQDDSLPSFDVKGSSQIIEMNFGKVAVLLLGWLHWWQELKPHQSRAILLAALAIVFAVGCFLAAQHELRPKR